MVSCLPGQQETLPGFKWIGTRIHELSQAGRTVLFSFEESIGSRILAWSSCRSSC